MSDNAPASIYKAQKEKYALLLGELQKKRKQLGWARFIVFIITVIITYKVFVSAGLYGLIVVAAGITLLLVLVSYDSDNNHHIANTKKRIQINEEELQALNNNYLFRADGSEFAETSHSYATDLDLFGKSSLFQMLNRCYTEQGKKKLAGNLLAPLSLQEIQGRKEAVKEIVTAYDWRQQFQSIAMQTSVTQLSEEKATRWLQKEEKHFIHPFWKVFVPVYTFVTLGSLLATILGFIPIAVFSFLFIVYLAFSGILIRNAAGAYGDLTSIIKEVSIVHDLLECIENSGFNSPLINRMKQSATNKSATSQIKELKAILGRFDYLLNMILSVFLNSFLLWGVRQMMSLNEWRRNNRTSLPAWFDLVAEMEVLNSLATLHLNYPHWVFPAFASEHFTFTGNKIGHPLIPEQKRIDNDFTLTGKGKIALITGSNMAGKSTFLRSLGVNVVLAQAGAVVCANQLTISPVHLMSSMRIADNLAEDTSTFYAELKKLKTIIDAANEHRPIFILLDEILRGTNSLDRHKGSEALIAQLIKEQAVAVIATHDIELAGLKKTFPDAIENYHFDVQVEGEELYFDYLLKQGVCTSMNASILMKKIGINTSVLSQ